MLNSIIKFSINQKIVVGFFLVCLTTWGIYSLTKLPIDAIPDITNNQVQVITQSPNLAPLEIERYITTPIELSTANIPGLIETRSISRFGLSLVTLVFEDDVDVYWARTQVSERLKNAQEMIPAGIANPSLAPVSTGLSEIFQYTLSLDEKSDTSYSLMDLRTIQDWMVRRELLHVKGVADVSSFGGYLKQYQVSVNPELLKSTNTTLDEIFKALEQGNSNTGAAYIEKDDKAYFIRGIGMTMNISDIENTVIKNEEGVPVLMKDVAKIELASTVRYGAMSMNGKGETVGGILLMLKGENASQVIVRVKESMASIEKTLPRGIKIEPFIDRENLVNRAISTVEKNLIEGGLIVIFVLVLLLGNFRAGLIVASVIPLSMLFAISMMVTFGVSGNLMSLGAIDFGLIVDGAVIIVEIIARKLSERIASSKTVLTKIEFEETIFKGTSEIIQSASFGQFIILIVYIPILAFTGIEGKMFKPMALSVIFALLGAFILSLTYVPFISAIFMSHKAHEKENFADKIINSMKSVYRPMLDWALRNQRLVVGLSIGMLLSAVLVFGKLGGEFIPTLNEGDYAVEVRMLPGTSFTQTLSIADKIQKSLLDSFPNEIKKCISKVGTSEIPTDPMPIEAMDLIIVLKDKSEWKRVSNKEELDIQLENVLSNFPGIIYSVQQPIQMRFNELMTSAKTDVVIKLYGNDLDVLSAKANEIAGIAAKIEGADDVQVQKIAGLPQIQIVYNRSQLANYGVTVSEVNDVIQTAFAGKKAGLIFEQEKSFDLVVRLAEPFRKEVDDLKELMLTTSKNQSIPLKELAEITIEKGPAEISRDNTKRKINIGFNARGRDVESIVHDLQKKIDEQLKLPTGYSLVYGGQFENLAHAKDRLSIVLPITFLLIFILLFIVFRSIKQALLILSAIPLAAVGGVLSLWLRDMPFSISAGIGFIALFGVAVLNGIVLIGYLNQLEQEGYTDLDERIHKALSDRFRPVVMTALVASLGFLPMALSHGPGAEVQKPLATVVVGGLITSTFLKLIVLPVLYGMTHRKRKGLLGVVTFILLLCFGFNSDAQEVKTIFPSLEISIESAMKNYPLMSIADKNIQQQKALKSSSFNPPQLDVLWQVPVSTKFSPAIMQSFEFPLVYTSQNGMYNQQIKIAEVEKNISKTQLVKAVKDAYQHLIYTIVVLNELKFEDSIYHDLYRNAELKYKAGDISNLEKLNMESNYALVKNRLMNGGAAYDNALIQFRNLTGINNEFETQNINLKKTDFLLASTDTSFTENNPGVTFYKENITLREKSLSNAKWKLMPGFSVGYFNQTELNNGQLYNFQFGLKVPLFFWSYTSKIKYEKIGVKHEQAKLELAKRNLNSQYFQAVSDFNANTRNVAFYENTGMKQADEMMRATQRSFSSGEINYYNFIMNMDKVMRIRIAYLDAINQFNLSVYQIQYLKGDIK